MISTSRLFVVVPAFLCWCLCLVSLPGCGNENARNEASMPSAEEVEISAEDNDAMTAERVGGSDDGTGTL
jgi:hypothetical protein